MQPEESVEIDHLVLRNRNARPHRIVVLLAIGNHDVEPIRRATLKDHHHPPIGNARRLASTERTRKPGSAVVPAIANAPR